MKEHVVVPFRTGCFSGSLDNQKLQGTLNEYGQQGWKLTKTIHETEQVFIGIQREAHFLIFEKPADGGNKQLQGRQSQARQISSE